MDRQAQAQAATAVSGPSLWSESLQAAACGLQPGGLPIPRQHVIRQRRERVAFRARREPAEVIARGFGVLVRAAARRNRARRTTRAARTARPTSRS